MEGLKNKIENEIKKLNQLFDKTIDDLKKSYQKKYEILLKEENELIENLFTVDFEVSDKYEEEVDIPFIYYLI